MKISALKSIPVQQGAKDGLKNCLYDFVQGYALPSLADDSIFLAHQNRFSLPDQMDEYAVIEVASATRHGTSVTEIKASENGDDRLIIVSLFEYTVKLDFYSNSDAAKQRAMALANISGEIGPDFFKRYGCSLLHTSDPKNMTGINDSNQYLQRWQLEISATMPEVSSFPIETATCVGFSRFEDVDAHHKA